MTTRLDPFDWMIKYLDSSNGTGVLKKCQVRLCAAVSHYYSEQHTCVIFAAFSQFDSILLLFEE